MTRINTQLLKFFGWMDEIFHCERSISHLEQLRTRGAPVTLTTITQVAYTTAAIIKRGMTAAADLLMVLSLRGVAIAMEEWTLLVMPCPSVLLTSGAQPPSTMLGREFREKDKSRVMSSRDKIIPVPTC